MRRHGKPAFLALAFALILGAPLSAQTDARIDEFFADFDRPGSPGAAVLVVKDGEVVYRNGFGLANLEHSIPITGSTIFDIASVSKQFAGMAIAMLVEAGRIDLAADIRTYLPEMPRFEHTVTVDHLVHHTSGIRDWPGTLAVAGWRMDDVISFDQILRMARNQQDLNFTPGAEYSYSNTGYNILAALVARVSGQTFREWTEENIFAPLGMDDTHFHDDHTEVVPNRAQGYARTEDGFHSVPNGLTALGSSSLYTTVDDLARWVINFDDGLVGGMKVIERMQERGVLNNGIRIAYAFGQSIGEHRGVTTWSHSGSWAGFRTVLYRVPEHRFGVVILSNVGSYNPAPVARAVADIYLADVLDPVVEQQPDTEPDAVRPIAVSTDLLEEYAGTYRLGPRLLFVTLVEGRLMSEVSGDGRYPMTAVSDTEFFVEAYRTSLIFGRDAEGSVDHVTFRGLRARRAEAPEEDLRIYEGEYCSPELDACYRLVVRDGTLVALHRRHGTIELTPVLRDRFRGNQWFVPDLEFDRDAQDAIVGFRITQGRSRNIRFEAENR